MTEPRKPFWAKCGCCSHCWPAAYLPMDLSACAKLLKRIACPMCGAGTKSIYPAKQDRGVLLEPQAVAGIAPPADSGGLVKKGV